MKIKLISIGKTDDKNLIQLIDGYQKRLRHYIKFEFEIIPDIKQLVFVIGGSYGFSEKIYQKAQGKVSLSKMTFFTSNDSTFYNRTTLQRIYHPKK